MVSESPARIVRFETIGHVALVTISRPEALNSVNADLATALGETIERAQQDAAVRVIVITGDGRAFSTGMDLKAFAAGEDVAPRGHPEWGFAGVVRHAVDKPVIAAVNGLAFGGGAEIAFAADLIVADEDAIFRLPEVAIGLFAAAGGVLRLGQQLPQRIAAELVLTGRSFTAQEAERWGLVNEVAPAGTVVDRALALASTIAANAPLAVQASNRILRASRTDDSWGDIAWARNTAEMERVFGSVDALEGATAFAEKRAPVWRGV